jgi:DNA-binding transcriptional ArsR family regulator
LWIYGGGMTDPTDRPTLEQLTALHHPMRRRILELLRVSGPATVGAVATALQQQVGSISHHLRTLERTGFVAPAPELARDGRESWWRSLEREMTWSITDYADSPTDTLLAASVERANLQHHTDKVLTWFAERDGYDDAWLDAAFASEEWASATPEELTDLARRVYAVMHTWAGECAAAGERERAAGEHEATARRTPVFVFAHGTPSRP